MPNRLEKIFRKPQGGDFFDSHCRAVQIQLVTDNESYKSFTRTLRLLNTDTTRFMSLNITTTVTKSLNFD